MPFFRCASENKNDTNSNYLLHGVRDHLGRTVVIALTPDNFNRAVVALQEQLEDQATTELKITSMFIKLASSWMCFFLRFGHADATFSGLRMKGFI